MTLVEGQISHRGAATQLGPELWLGRCAEWQGGKGITDTREQASLGNEMLSGTQMALATGSLAPPMIQDCDSSAVGYIRVRTRGTHTFDLVIGDQGAARGWEEHRKGKSIIIIFLAMLPGMWDLSFLIRDGNCTPCLESTES